MSADLVSDLTRQRAVHADLKAKAQALGTSPEARIVWELTHEYAGIVAKIESRLQEKSWAA